MRLTRKLEHIEMSLDQKDRANSTGFDDILLIHNSLPQLDWEEVDTSCTLLGKLLAAPILINAMTGGHPDLEQINYSLAKAAGDAGLAMAVGSQRAALEDSSARASFEVVREGNPGGLILANLGADCTEIEAKEAISMVKADGIQLHLNAPQELAMLEGDRNFRGLLENIELLKSRLAVPVLVKEVGFGMSRETARRLIRAGINYVDIGGAGGTDFMAIEELRAGRTSNWAWGIPTAISLLEVIKEKNQHTSIIASGGIEHALDCVKALCLGASMVGIARPLLRILVRESEQGLARFLGQLLLDIRRIMLMLGAKNLTDLTSVPVIIGGYTNHWLCRRGIDTDLYARRTGLHS